MKVVCVVEWISNNEYAHLTYDQSYSNSIITAHQQLETHPIPTLTSTIHQSYMQHLYFIYSYHLYYLHPLQYNLNTHQPISYQTSSPSLTTATNE